MLNLRVSAVVLGLTLAVAGRAFTSAETDGSEISSQWIYDSTLGPKTEPESYKEGMKSSCPTGNNQLCGIITEEDPENPGYPLITEDLLSRIEAEDVSEGDVFLRN